MKTEKKSGVQRSQPSVTDEWWDDDRVREFLRLESTEDENPDFHILSKAYRGMVPDSFGRFVKFFVEEGRDINETNPQGETILDVVSRHRNSGEYSKILEQNGAKKSAH